MNVLVIGSGGREHALAWKISQSQEVAEIYVAPGNGAEGFQNAKIDVSDHSQVKDFCLENWIDLVVVGPEAPLAKGLVDDLLADGLVVFGPGQKCAQLESSKLFAKRFMQKWGIPTAEWRWLTWGGIMSRGLVPTVAELSLLLEQWGGSCVVKADGLAGGKGVIVCEGSKELLLALQSLMRDFPEATRDIIIEQKLEGPELSYIVIADGESYVPLPPSRDYKRQKTGDQGPNTGGMGAFTPVPISDVLRENIEESIIQPALHGISLDMQESYCGFLYAGLMLTEDGPKVLEFNVRGGDPETEALMVAVEDDLAPIIDDAASGRLHTHYYSTLTLQTSPTCCVVIADELYPKARHSTRGIYGIRTADTLEGVKVFHCGTKNFEGEILTAGGRLLAVTAKGDTAEEARAKAYEAVGRIEVEHAQHRTDIGQ